MLRDIADDYRPTFKRLLRQSARALVIVDCQVTPGNVSVAGSMDILPPLRAWAILPDRHRTPPGSLTRPVIDHRLIPARSVGIPTSVHPLVHIPGTSLRRPLGELPGESRIALRVPGQRRGQLSH